MNVTRVARPSFADPRRGLVSVLTVMLLVFAVVVVQAVCGVHPHAADHSGASTGSAVGQQYVAVAMQAAQAAPEHPGQDPYHCAEDRTITARYDRTVSPSTDLAGVPALAMQWPVPAVVDHGTRAPSGLAAATAPSLHALGISRT